MERYDEVKMSTFAENRYEFSGNSGRIVRCACRTLGVSRRALLQEIRKRGWKMSWHRLFWVGCDTSGWRTSASEWFILCQVLRLDMDCLRYGYNAHWHLMRVRGDIARGEFEFPVVPKLRAALEALDEWDRRRLQETERAWGLPFSLNRDAQNVLRREGDLQYT